MKEVKSKTGETELQTPEYMTHGPVKITGVGRADLIKRIEVLEAQVASLQAAAPKHIAHPGPKKTKP